MDDVLFSRGGGGATNVFRGTIEERERRKGVVLNLIGFEVIEVWREEAKRSTARAMREEEEEEGGRTRRTEESLSYPI